MKQSKTLPSKLRAGEPSFPCVPLLEPLAEAKHTHRPCSEPPSLPAGYGQPLYSSSIPPPGNLMRGDYNTENLATHSKRTFHPFYYCNPHSDKHSHPSEEGKDKGLKVKRILGSEQAHTLQGIRHSRHQVCTEILDLQLLPSRHFHMSSFCFLKKKMDRICLLEL